MTTVHIALADTAGRHYMRWQRYRADGVSPVRRCLLTDGAGTFAADPAGVWFVTEPGQPFGQYVAVPETTQALYAALPVVDPVTLDPAIAPKPAWEAALDTLAAQVGGITRQVAVDGADPDVLVVMI